MLEVFILGLGELGALAGRTATHDVGEFVGSSLIERDVVIPTAILEAELGVAVPADITQRGEHLPTDDTRDVKPSRLSVES
jgi:hypothetical protein